MSNSTSPTPALNTTTPIPAPSVPSRTPFTAITFPIPREFRRACAAQSSLRNQEQAASASAPTSLRSLTTAYTALTTLTSHIRTHALWPRDHWLRLEELVCQAQVAVEVDDLESFERVHQIVVRVYSEEAMGMRRRLGVAEGALGVAVAEAGERVRAERVERERVERERAEKDKMAREKEERRKKQKDRREMKEQMKEVKAEKVIEEEGLEEEEIREKVVEKKAEKKTEVEDSQQASYTRMTSDDSPKVSRAQLAAQINADKRTTWQILAKEDWTEDLGGDLADELQAMDAKEPPCPVVFKSVGLSLNSQMTEEMAHLNTKMNWMEYGKLPSNSGTPSFNTRKRSREEKSTAPQPPISKRSKLDSPVRERSPVKRPARSPAGMRGGRRALKVPPAAAEPLAAALASPATPPAVPSAAPSPPVKKVEPTQPTPAPRQPASTHAVLKPQNSMRVEKTKTGPDIRRDTEPSSTAGLASPGPAARHNSRSGRRTSPAAVRQRSPSLTYLPTNSTTAPASCKPSASAAAKDIKTMPLTDRKALLKDAFAGVEKCLRAIFARNVWPEGFPTARSLRLRLPLAAEDGDVPLFKRDIIGSGLLEAYGQAKKRPMPKSNKAFFDLLVELGRDEEL